MIVHIEKLKRLVSNWKRNVCVVQKKMFVMIWMNGTFSCLSLSFDSVSMPVEPDLRERLKTPPLYGT